MKKGTDVIVDTIENAKIYSCLSWRLKEALGLLNNQDVISAADGRYAVDGDELFYIVMHYRTKPMAQCRLESHKKYIDIQFIADGSEMFGYAPAGTLAITEKYNAEKDVEFYKTPVNFSRISFTKGMFSIFFPHDIHMPCCQLDSPADVHKIVLKVKI